MKGKELLFSNEVQLEDLRMMRLEYCLTESHSEEDASKPYYGIHIVKYLEGITEADEVRGVSNCKETVINMVRKLFQYEVTPISMIEIIDELVTLAG